MDPVDAWQEAFERVCTLVESRSDEQMETVVPACPAWTARELLAHMIGLDADILAEDHPDDHNQTWTQKQVDERADRTPAQLLAEWREIAGPLVAWMRANDTRPVGDVSIHEQDLRGALGVPGGRDGAGLAIVRDHMLGGLADALTDRPPLALLGETIHWASEGDPDDAEVALRGTDFDLTRALMTRRTESQVRDMAERGDVGPYLDAFAGLGPLPTEPLPE